MFYLLWKFVYFSQGQAYSHHPCLEHLPGGTLRRSPSGPAASFCFASLQSFWSTFLLAQTFLGARESTARIVSSPRKINLNASLAESWKKFSVQSQRTSGTHPGRHGVGVRLPVVIVEDHDGGDHGAGHHEHDAVEVRPCNQSLSYEKELFY